MGRDPAILFYPGDVLQQIAFFNLKQKGVYLQLVCTQREIISFSYDDLMLITSELSDVERRGIFSKLKEISPGKFLIEWLEESIKLRKKYSESRSDNRKLGYLNKKKDSNISTSYDNHIEEKRKEIKKKRKEENGEDFEYMEYPSFEDFWDLYDKRVGRPASEKEWKKLTQKEREAVIQHLPAYIASTPDKAYRKDPERYLKKETFNDEIIIPNGTIQNQKPHEGIAGQSIEVLKRIISGEGR